MRSGINPLVPADNLEMLTDAIARNAGIVLSLPSAGMLRHHKSRFLAAGRGGFWVEAAPGEGPLIDSLIVSQQSAGISFKAAHIKVVFPTTVLHRDPVYTINSSVQVEALLLAMPAEIKAIQRRNNHRAQIAAGRELTARTWRIAEHTYLGDRPTHAQEVVCELRDLSVGGMGVMFLGKDGQPPKVSNEDRLRIELSHGENKILLEGRMRYPTTPIQETSARAGVQFKALEDHLDGRQILAQLTRIVGELQREEVRRFRLGLSKAS
jgi:c-di-GMP-binding flagellar brake protein YcgR